MKRLVTTVLLICFSCYRPVVPIEQNGGSRIQEIRYKFSGSIDDVFSDSDLLNPEMDAACSSRTSVSPYSTERCTDPKGYNVKKSL
jgi:hypothetical protein